MWIQADLENKPLCQSEGGGCLKRKRTVKHKERRAMTVKNDIPDPGDNV